MSSDDDKCFQCQELGHMACMQLKAAQELTTTLIHLILSKCYVK